MDVESDGGFVEEFKGSRGQQANRNYARFYPKWIRNNFKSEKEGREIGEYRDFVMIVCPGQDKQQVHREATETDKRDYPTQWADYKNGKEQRLNGTPIERLPGLPESRALSLKAIYIHSIEQLAELADESLQRVGMGAVDLRNQAKAYLANSSREVVALKQEIEKRDQVISGQQEAIRGLEARLSALEQAPAPKRRGRPPKAQPAETH